MAIWNKVTQEEINLIKSKKYNTKELSLLLNRHFGTITKIARENGVKLPRRIVRKYEINENFFDNWNKENAYWIGFIAADGCILEDKKGEPATLNIALAEKDEEHLKTFRNIIGIKIPIKYKEKYKSVSLNVCSKSLCKKFVENGVTPRKSLTLKWIRNIPIDLISDFVRGYFDGDGYVRIIINKKYGYKNLEYSILGTEDFLNGIKNEFCKIYGKSIGSLKSCQKWFNAYRLTFSTRSALHFGKWIYTGSTVRLERKYKIFELFIKNANVPSFSSGVK